MTHPPDVEIVRKTCPPLWGVKDTPDMERRHAIARLVLLLIILAIIAFVLWLGMRGAGADQNRPIPAVSPSSVTYKGYSEVSPWKQTILEDGTIITVEKDLRYLGYVKFQKAHGLPVLPYTTWPGRERARGTR